MENNDKLRRSQGVHTNNLHQDSTSSSESEHAAPRLKVKPKMDRTSSEEDDKSSESIEQSPSKLVPEHFGPSYKLKVHKSRYLNELPSELIFQKVDSSVKRPLGVEMSKRRKPSRKPLHQERTHQPASHPEHDNQESDKIQPPRKRPLVFSNIRNMFQKRSEEVKQDKMETGLHPDEEHGKQYRFDHGDPAYYRTTDCPPPLLSDLAVKRVEAAATRFWAEIFGFLNIFVVFWLTGVLQLFRFILNSIFRTAIVGFFQTLSDYLLKPWLAVMFNGFLQPLMTFVQNICRSISDMLQPLTVLAGNVVAPFAQLIGAFRIVEIKKQKKVTHEWPRMNQTDGLQGQTDV